jgi:DNA-directed RNA polymerase I, II, and III subunit RPABC5
MIIPVKCFTCGNVLANKYRYYKDEVLKMKIEESKKLSENEKQTVFQMVYLTKGQAKKTPEGVILDKIGIKNMCCRRHMLTHVDIE